MRAALVIFSALAVAGCQDPLSDWETSGVTATAEAELGDTLPNVSTMSETRRLLATAPDVDKLTIRYFGLGQDKLGNESRAPFYSATFDGNQVSRANFENLDMFEASSLAESVDIESVQGRVVLAARCPFTEAVCMTALKQPEPQ